MKHKLSIKCRNCNTKEESFLFDSEVKYTNPRYKCSKCGACFEINIEKYSE